MQEEQRQWEEAAEEPERELVPVRPLQRREEEQLRRLALPMPGSPEDIARDGRPFEVDQDGRPIDDELILSHEHEYDEDEDSEPGAKTTDEEFRTPQILDDGKSSSTEQGVPGIRTKADPEKAAAFEKLMAQIEGRETDPETGQTKDLEWLQREMGRRFPSKAATQREIDRLLDQQAAGDISQHEFDEKMAEVRAAIQRQRLRDAGRSLEQKES